MYIRKNDLSFIIQDNQSYTGEDGTKYPRNYPKDEITELAQVTETDKPEADVITGYYVDETYTQVWETRDYTSEEIIDNKKSLLVSIKSKQRKAMFENADIYAIKAYQAELQDKTDKATIKAQSKQVADWCDVIREQNDNITIDNTVEEIQARLDTIDSYVSIFPYTTQTDYDNDELNFRR